MFLSFRVTGPVGILECCIETIPKNTPTFYSLVIYGGWKPIPDFANFQGCYNVPQEDI